MVGERLDHPRPIPYEQKVLKGLKQEVRLHCTLQITLEWCQDNSSFGYEEKRDETPYLLNWLIDL